MNKKVVVVVVILALSVFLNIALIYNYTIMAKRLNTTFYNLTLNFANSLARNNPNRIDDVKTVYFVEYGIKNIEQELGNVQLLPSGAFIIGGQTILNIEALLKYKSLVLGQMEKELEQQGKISQTTNKKYEKAQQIQSEMVKTFMAQLKTLNPFAPVFNIWKWRSVYQMSISNQSVAQLKPPLSQ